MLLKAIGSFRHGLQTGTAVSASRQLRGCASQLTQRTGPGNSVVAKLESLRHGSVFAMWVTVLLMTLGAATDPLRVGMVFILTSRQRPLPNLLAFWLGGMTASIGVAVAVLLVLRDVALVVTHNLTSVVAGFVTGRTEITVGVLVLLAAAYLATRRRKPVPVAYGDAPIPELQPMSVACGDAPVAAPQPMTSTAFSSLTARGRGMLTSGFVWPAYLVGIGSVTPPVESVVVLTMIMASRTTIGFQLGAFVAWTLVVLAIVEIPLVSYLVTPDKTQATMLRLQNWLVVYRRQIMQFGLLSLGVTAVVKGVGAL